MRPELATVTLVALLTILPTRAADPDPKSPAFWISRAAQQLPAAPAIEYDGHIGTPRLTAAESAADLYRLDPSPANRTLLTDKLTATAAQLDFVTQPLRRWYAHLVLARVYRAALKDDDGYQRHLAAARKLDEFLPDRQKDGPFYGRVRGAQFAAAGDADALRKECADATAAPLDRIRWYADVVAWSRQFGLHDAAAAALDQITADAAALPPGDPGRQLADHVVAAEAARLGEYALALEAVRALDGPRKFDAAVRVFRRARRDGRTDVAQSARAILANLRPPGGGAAVGDYVAELAAAGQSKAAADIGRAALKRGAAFEPELFYATLAAGLAAAGDRASALDAKSIARRAADKTPDRLLRARSVLALAAAHAATGDFDATIACSEEAADVPDVSDAELVPDRARLLDTLLDLKRWDDAVAQLDPIFSQRDRELWTPRIVAAMVRAGATDLAVDTAAKPEDGFIRARALRRVAIERAKKNDLVKLPDWIDHHLDTPLRRAATNLSIAQLLSRKPVRATGFPPDEE